MHGTHHLSQYDKPNSLRFDKPDTLRFDKPDSLRSNHTHRPLPMPEELERDLGLPSVIAISMGAMIGSGIFVLPGIAMVDAGPAVILAFVIAAVLVFPAALSIAELGTAMPEAGGDYIFIERGMGPAAGTIAGLGTWLMLMFKGSLALLGGMIYLGPVFARFDINLDVQFVEYGFFSMGAFELIAVLVGLLLITVNIVGVKQTGGLQKVLVIVMLVILGGFVALAVGDVESAGYDGFFAEGSAGLFAATATVLISYGGVTKVAAVAEEIEKPGRNLPLGLLLSLVLTAGLYALIVFVLVGTVDATVLEGSDTPMVDGVDPLFGFVGVVLIVIAAMFALISTANAGILTASRYPFALSRDNLLPYFLGDISDRFRTPVTAILITGGVMLFVVLALPVDEIAKTAGAFQIVVYILVCISLMAFRYRSPDWYNPEFRAPLYPWVQVFGVLSGLFILTQMELLAQAGGVGIALFGGAWYYMYGRPRVNRTGIMSETLVDIVEPEQPEGGKKPYRVLVPVASLERERGLLQLAAARAAKYDDAELVAMNVITVPEQTSLAQEVSYERERIERQQALLTEAEGIAEELGIGLRTHAIVGRDVGRTVLDVIESEQADCVVMGWSGTRKRRNRVLGSNIDQILERAPCEVSLVRVSGDRVGDTVAFVNESAYAPVAASQAASFVRAEPDASLTLVNIQSVGEDESEADARERGDRLISEVADRAGIDAFDSRVVLGDDIETAILRVAADYETAVIGLSRASTLEEVLSPSISDTIGEAHDGKLVVVRGPEGTALSLRTAIARRISS